MSKHISRKRHATADLDMIDRIHAYKRRLHLLHCAIFGLDVDPDDRDALALALEEARGELAEIIAALNATREIDERFAGAGEA